MSKIDGGNYSAWRKFDIQSVAVENQDGTRSVDHGQSAIENLEDAGSSFVKGVTIPFMAPFMNDGLMGGSVSGIGDRIGNTLMGLAISPLMIGGAVKDGLDAAIHGVANLFD